ncbi:MAG: porin [Burkholderiaceae bacterium]|nr:porin [Burkholderiaceae bacterium]MDZ4144731.1 porin [Burkholderiales bacterium]
MNAKNRIFGELDSVLAHAIGRRQQPVWRGRKAGPLTRTMLGCVALACTAMGPAHAQITIEKNGWKADVNGLISVWGGNENFSAATGRPQESTQRVRSGFNPSKLEVTAHAPEYNGINVSGYFQLAASINGNKSQRTGEQIEVRGADLSISSQYGTFSAGRNFNIYGSLPIANDTGSMRGVGYLCTGPDGNGPNCGHIGTGYTWSDFSAGLRYTSPRVSGFQVRLGVYDPIETAFGTPGGGTPFIGLSNGTFTNFTSIGSAVETRPLLQGDINWASNPFALGGTTTGSALIWLGGLNQRIKDLGNSSDSAHIKGFNLGSRLTAKAPVGVFGLTTNYEKTFGIAEGFMGFGARCNVGGCDTVRGQQWYVNADYTFAGKTTFGTSFGRGWENANAFVGNDNVKRRLWVAYVQHQLTPNVNVNVEVQRFRRSTDGAGNAAGIFPGQERYVAALLGVEFRF